MATETYLPLYMSDVDESNIVDVMGRMSVGGSMDETDFDLLPRNRIYETPNQAEGAGGDELDLMAGAPDPFESPPPERFPLFKRALKHFSAAAAKPRAVRIDTDETFGAFVAESAIREVARRVDALEDALAHHDEDPMAHEAAFKHHVAQYHHEVLGAVVSKLQSASTSGEAIDALPGVLVDVPAKVKDAVKCWRDGDRVVCSLRFDAVDGPRIATMAATPRVDEDELTGCALRVGVDPVTVLGVAEDVAEVACGKRLLREIAGAALASQRRIDVCGIDEPIHLTAKGDSVMAPLAALMHLEQRADAGDAQAAGELHEITQAANTPVGRKVAMPLIAEARRRLAVGRARKAALVKKPTLAQRHAERMLLL